MHYLDSINFRNTKILKPGETLEALSPEAARQLLEDNGVEFSEKSFVCLGFNPDIVKLFLQAEMNPDAVVELGYDGTEYGVGDTDVYTPTRRDAGSATALIIAAKYESEKALQILIDHGVDPNIKTYWGSAGGTREKERTALAVSIYSGNRTISELLIEAGAEIEQSAVNEQLLMTADSGDPEIVNLLLERFHADPKTTFPENRGRFTKGDTPLIRAAGSDYVNGSWEPKGEEILKLLLASGADVTRKNSEGQTALMAATAAGATPAIQLVLLRAGADPRAKDKEGKTALMLAKNNFDCDPLRAALEGNLNSYADSYYLERKKSKLLEQIVVHTMIALIALFCMAMALAFAAIIIITLDWVGVPIHSGLMYWANLFLDIVFFDS